MRVSNFILATLLAATTCTVARAEDDGEVTPVYVWGKREDRIGLSSSATEGQVAFATYADRPLLRPAELMEVIPGLAATQHSGSGKANQYFLRGFNLDHGTDFSVSLDGAPLNLRTNAHGQGYLDLNFLTPETVETVGYRKGPYFAPVGDFSAAGSATLSTFARLPESFVSTTVGHYNYGRVLGAANVGEGYVAADLTIGDGPWVSPENLRRGSLFARQQIAGWNVSLLGYTSNWNATDQVPLRAIASGALDRYGAVDSTDGGRSRRFLLAVQHDFGDGWKTNAYVQHYRLRLWSNFTYFLDDPVNGDQFEQAESRWIAGGTASRSWTAGDAWTFAAGAETRYDHIGSIGLYRTRARLRLSTDREDQVDQLSGAAWGEAAYRSGPFRAVLGARVDGMTVDVKSIDLRNSGDAADAIVSPKLALAWRLGDHAELYANAGRGYHSNDARGATARVAPDGMTPLEPVSLLVPATGGEVGMRWEQPGFTTSLAVWTLNLDAELVYTGDAGDTESTDASRRLGVEALVNWSPTPRLNFDLSAAATRARYRDAPGADRIPNAFEYVVTGGVSARLTDALTGEITVRRLGRAPLIEDNSARGPASTVVNGLLRYRLGRYAFTVEALNLANSRANDITYFYTSRLRGEPAGGVGDYHLHPMEPRTIRAGVKINFGS